MHFYSLCFCDKKNVKGTRGKRLICKKNDMKYLRGSYSNKPVRTPYSIVGLTNLKLIFSIYARLFSSVTVEMAF